MNRNRILNVLYDLSSTVGGEVSLQPLLTKTLQRLMYHMDFPCGLILLESADCDSLHLKLEMGIGDSRAAESIGSSFPISLHKIENEYVCTTQDRELIRALPCRQEYYKTALQFPVPHLGWILLLSPRITHFDLPLDAVFLPFLANFGKAVHLSRINDEQVNTLEYLVEKRTKELQSSYEALKMEAAEHKRTDEALRSSEEQLRSIYDNLQDAFIRCDIQGRILKASPSSCRLMECSEDGLVGRNIAEFCVGRREAKKFFLALRKNEGTIEKYRSLIHKPNGKGVWISVSAHFVYDEMGQVVGIEGTARDITESVVAEIQLASETEKKLQLLAEKQRLSREIILAQEKERSFLAKELHDVMGQSLTYINTLASIICSVSSDDKVVDPAKKISEYIDNMFGSVRVISKALRPHMLDSVGLCLAIEDLLETGCQQTNVKSSFTTSGDTYGLPDIVNIVLYRSVQEALTNVLRHSKADRIDVSLHRRPEQNEFKSISSNIILEIKDNGHGMNLNNSGIKGLGMIGMRERVSAVAGVCDVTSSPGEGVHISIVIPLED